jgi:biopolymer transport protein ExbB
MNLFLTIATFYKEGGPFMHAVLAIMVTVIAIAVERLIVIQKANRIDTRRFTDELVRFAAHGDLMGARRAAMGSDTPVARVAQAMLQSAGSDETSLQSAADDAATLAMPDLTRRLAFMGVLANSATLIGLLGTITGLITAISGVGVADAAQRSAHLSAGISEALHTTAFGLIIAIPTLMLQGWLGSRVENVAESIDHLAIRLGKAIAQPAASQGAPLPLPRAAVAPLTAAAPVARAAAPAHGAGR